MKDKYVSPLSERYASKEMQYIFSPDMKFKTWSNAFSKAKNTHIGNDDRINTDTFKEF